MAGNLVSNNQKTYKITPNELAQALLLEQVKFLKQHYIYSKDHPAFDPAALSLFGKGAA